MPKRNDHPVEDPVQANAVSALASEIGGPKACRCSELRAGTVVAQAQNTAQSASVSDPLKKV